MSVRLRNATIGDVPQIRQFILNLARYEKLEHEMIATEDQLSETLFGDRRFAEVVIAEWDGEPAGFALYFFNYSTFMARPDIYLEDLYVEQEFRGRGIGRRLLTHLAGVAVENDCGRVEWSVLDWNEPAQNFYSSIGAKNMDGWNLNRLTGKALRDLAASD